MVEPLLYAALGFLTASLIALFFGRALWNRAVRLTTHRIMRRLPLSRDEIVASRDLVRAQLAVEQRRLERQANIMRERMTASMADVGRRSQTILDLKQQTDVDRAALAEASQLQAIAKAQIDRLGADLTAARNKLAETERILASTRQELKHAHDDRSELVRLADDRRIESATVQSESAQASQIVATLERQLAAARRANDETQDRLNRANEAARTETARAEDIHQKLIEAERQLSQAVSKLELNEREFQRSLGTLQAEKNGLLGQLSASVINPHSAAESDDVAALRREMERLASDIARAAEKPALESSTVSN